MEKARQKRADRRRVKKILRYEKRYSVNPYTDSSRGMTSVTDGDSAVAVAAVCPVNGDASEMDPDGIRSCAIAGLLADETGCPALAVCDATGAEQRRETAGEIRKHIEQKKIRAIIEIYLADLREGAVIELDPDLPGKDGFVTRVLRYSFEYRYRDRDVKPVAVRKGPAHSGMLKTAAEEQNAFYASVGLNRQYCTGLKDGHFPEMYQHLLDTLAMLTNVDWQAEKLNVYRLWKSGTHKPQDAIQLTAPAGAAGEFEKNSLLSICTYGKELERVRLHSAQKKTVSDMEKLIEQGRTSREYVFLTNRLIEILFSREWIENQEELPGLRDAPVIVYESRREAYPVGLPKANQIDGVSFSSLLYKEKKEEAEQYDFVVFNRYTDSRLYVEYDKADYQDFGRIQDENGNPARWVMIPRYYKKLLGYLDLPVQMIRSEEYEEIIRRLGKETEKGKLFQDCYEQIRGEIFYNLKKEYVDNDGEETDNDTDPDILKTKAALIQIQKELGLINQVEVLRVPKEVKPKETLRERIRGRISRIRNRLLEKTIGKSEYLLKTQWTSLTDDRNNIARLSPNMMSLLGVTENDKIQIRFGRRQKNLRVLQNSELTDYQIGIPAPARKDLGMNSVNDIVIVYRDMNHIFWRHSEEQTIAILGTILAVFQVISRMWVGVALCILFIPLIMYFVLNEERVKVK